ncbi:MAG: glycosyltransferase family 4 protein [Anaerolineales bacterium]
MRILYISQYFPPEAGATQTRAYEMAKNWVRLGHQVTMLTEFPNHPSGIMPQTYKGKFFEHVDLEGIDVIRVWVRASPEKNFINRMWFYLTFMVNASIASLFFAHGKYDFLYATSPPLFVGGAALFIRFYRRIPMVFEVRDLWPESAVALGELKNHQVVSIATRLEELCYRKAIQIIVVTHGIYERLINRRILPEKLIYIPNGANVELFAYDPIGRTRIRTELRLENKFVAIYAGIFGLAQGLEVILEAARLLVIRPEIHFVLIGDGPKKSKINSLAGSYNLPNLTLLSEKPREQIPAYLSAADVALAPLKKAEIFKGALPSKLFDAWACERPVILSIDGEARELVERINGGIYIPPEEPEKLAEAIQSLMNSPIESQMMGKNGLRYTKERHSRAALAEKLISHLENTIRA